jgi:hypothetical protein
MSYEENNWELLSAPARRAHNAWRKMKGLPPIAEPKGSFKAKPPQMRPLDDADRKEMRVAAMQFRGRPDVIPGPTGFSINGKAVKY